MARFGAKSKKQLLTCHIIWQEILNEAIKIYDFTVLEGYRGEVLQTRYYDSGVSKLPYPLSYHNKLDKNGNKESLGVDLAPHPLLWDADREQFLILAGIIIGIAFVRGYTVTWGNDWDRDFDFKDQTFHDLAHFQLEL